MKAKQRPGVVFQPRVHGALGRGIGTMAAALRPTLGPVACGVAVDHLGKLKALPEYLDEGGLIARRIIALPNRDEDMGAMLARAMIVRQHEEIGDGTATVAVLLDAIFSGGLRYLAAGGNAMQLRRHLEKALPLVLDELDRSVFPVEGEAALIRMARSLCHDDDLAALLGEAFDLVGEYGRLEIREDYGRVLRREYVEGSYFHTGLFSKTLFASEGETTRTLENPAIFLCDFEVEDHHDLFPVMQTAHAAGIKSLVIVARNLSEKAVSLLVTNNRMGKFNAVGIKLPGGTPAERMAALDDLSRLTGAAPYIQEAGQTLENVRAEDFGSARRVWADLRAFGIVGGGGSPARLREHIRTLKAVYHNAEEADVRKSARERIGNLLGGSVTLWLGGFTEPEIKARKMLAERAALSMRAALEEGVLPGGGIALLNCANMLKKLHAQAQDADERAAYRILIEALAAPARAIFRNAGCDPSEVLAKLAYEGADAGYDVLAQRVVNVCEAGILDSALVLKTSVRNAVSTAALALTIDSLVHLSKPEMMREPE